MSHSYYYKPVDVSFASVYVVRCMYLELTMELTTAQIPLSDGLCDRRDLVCCSTSETSRREISAVSGKVAGSSGAFYQSRSLWPEGTRHLLNSFHFKRQRSSNCTGLRCRAIVRAFYGGPYRPWLTQTPRFYDRETDAATAILTVFSASIFGYGLVGLLRSVIVHREPSSQVCLVSLL